jgi:TRAP-type C4-dicarboxylate transport system permease small subunit
MSRTEKWLTAMVVFGMTAGVLAAGLLWMVLTHPVALVEALARLQ